MCLRGASGIRSHWLDEDAREDVAVYMVWTPQLGAEERHVDGAAKLIADPRVVHYWDPGMAAGNAFQPLLGTSASAWDVWMLFGPDARWRGRPPEPAWWEHQLGELPPDRRLDFARFARKAQALPTHSGR